VGGPGQLLRSLTLRLPAHLKEPPDVPRLGRKRRDKPHEDPVGAEIEAGTRTYVIARAGGLQPRLERARQRHEDEIGLDREDRRKPERRQAQCQPLRHGVGVARELQPQAVGEIGGKLRGEETVLGQQVPAALAPLGHERGARRIEDHHGFGGERAAFGGAERQHIDAGLPGQLRRRRVETNQRIGKAGAVHVHGERAGMRNVGERGDFIQAIDRAGFSRLRDGERGRDHLMRSKIAVAGERGLQRGRGDLAGRARKLGELQSAAEEFRRAAFVGRDMRFGVAERDAPGRRDLRQRQRIGRRPGRDQKDGDFALEDVRQAALDLLRPGIVAVAARITAIGLRDGIEDFGRHRRRVVAGKIHETDTSRDCAARNRDGTVRNTGVARAPNGCMLDAQQEARLMKRRMAAILVGDIVGYSGLMEADEEGTAQRLAGCRKLIDAEIARCDGRLFKAMGDAVLVEFASPINALQCAVAIRSALALASQSGGPPLRMRFGLHVADVLVEGDDLIGDGVNLAARIQGSADPDAIDVSGALFEQIRRNSPFAFEDRGEQNFRNIARPVRVYRLRGEIDRHVYQIAPTQPTPTQAKRPYSLAVMPIEVATGNEEQGYLADGLTEELIFELGRFKKLFVASRTATRALSDSASTPQTVGERLGVRYVLAGALRQLGAQLRLSLSLSETETGGVVWSDRVSESFDKLVDRLDELVSRIASTVLGRIEESDIAAARRLKPESMTAYELYLRGLEYHRLGGIVDANLREAARWFARAIEADANFARPRAMWVCASSGLPEFDKLDGERRTQRALELDPNDPEANRIMGAILMHRGAFDAAREYHEKAMALSPSDAYIRGRSAAFYNFNGEPERALKLLDEAAELDPFLHVWCVEERAAVLYNLGRFREAIEAALRLTFQTRRSRLYRAAAHAALGEIEKARHAVAEAMVNAPDLTTDYLASREFYRDEAIKRRLLGSLIDAGLPAPRDPAYQA